MSIVETRCEHDMLQWPEMGFTSCATCKGLPWDVRPVDLDSGGLLAEDVSEPALRWFTVNEYEDRREKCSVCDESLIRGKRAAWSAERGNLCGDCARSVA